MREETRALIHKAKEGDKAALEKLTEDNLGLVRSCARRFRGRGADDEDLFQIGALGLIKALKRFDERFEVEFSTYAVPVILGEIRRFFRDDGWIKVSRSAKETARAVWEKKEEMEMREGRTPTLSELAEMLGKSPEEIAFAMEALRPAQSLEEPVQGGESTLRLLDMIPGKIEGEEEEALNRVMVSAALQGLSEEEKMLIRLRYYQGKTQTETARVLKVSQVQVSRMEKRILCRMRKGMEKEEIL